MGEFMSCLVEFGFLFIYRLEQTGTGGTRTPVTTYDC